MGRNSLSQNHTDNLSSIAEDIFRDFHETEELFLYFWAHKRCFAAPTVYKLGEKHDSIDSLWEKFYNRIMENCKLCPRRCGADRVKTTGFCGGGNEMKIAKVMLHYGEEPLISGSRGSGAIFFSGCNLKCVYCQNAPINSGNAGRIFTESEFIDAALRLRDAGAHNIDLITAGHYVHQLIPALEKLRARLDIPVVYNSSGYEYADTVKMLDGLIDVYLPDFKYAGRELAEKYSSAPDYASIAVEAIREMCRQRGKAVIENGLLKSGVIVRHLVLPGGRRDSIAAMRIIADSFENALVSIMRQYTPCFYRGSLPELKRKVTSFEYESVVDEAVKCGLNGFIQDGSSATDELTPDFNEIF